eukprot:maker-scaffold_7-snap-gene-7.32-mRNA-1 protein AED:0.01 eAED:0.01 QI:22/1/1/1/1/1/2/150/354
MEDLSPLLSKLIKREALTEDEAVFATEAIASGNANEHQVAAFLVLLASKGETSVEIMAMAKVMRQHVLKPVIESDEPKGFKNVIDIVGTGGDGMDTINISTSAAILASACGAIVAKHGSTSVSSKSGSSDVISKLGVPLLGPEKVGSFLEKAGMCFLYAPKYHPAMKHVVPIRKALKVRSIFNILGPLLNPFGVKRMLLGVYSEDLLPIYADAVFKLGVEHALVVHGSGMDELNTLGPVKIVEVTKTGKRSFTLDPFKDLALPKCSLADLKGGSAEENAAAIRNLFSNNIPSGEEEKYARLGETVALNAGVGLFVSGKYDSIKAGVDAALTCLRAGKAEDQLKNLVTIGTSLQE